MDLEVVEVVTPDSILEVERLAKAIWPEHYVPIIGLPQVTYMLDRFQSREAIESQLREGVLYYLLKNGREGIGYLSIYPDPERSELLLSKLYIQACMRRKGFGQKAIKFIEAIALEQGLKKITLRVNKNNIHSVKAYERMGFVIKNSVIKDIGGGFVMDDYEMEKRLEP